MNRLLRLAALGVALLPSAAFAQTPPADAPPARPQLTDTQRAQLRTSMEQSFAQMKALHQQERTQILGSLSAVHRSAVASIIGNLAVSPNPDYRTAAKQIDAMLSTNEQRAVVTSHEQARTQERSMREAQRTAFESVLTPAQRSAEDARRAAFEAQHGAADRQRENASRRTPDAGTVLLMLSHESAGGGHHFGGPGGPGGPGMGGPGPG